MRVPVIRSHTVRTVNGSTSWFLDKAQTNAHIAFFYIECVCNAWFTVEILVSMQLICLIEARSIENQIIVGSGVHLKGRHEHKVNTSILL